jgi:hypothetical protein
MPQVPVLDPRVKGGVLDVPARSNDFQSGTAGQLAGGLADDSKTPRARGGVGLVGWGDDGPNDPDFSWVGVEGLDIILVPEFNMFLIIEIVVDLAGWLSLP